MPELRLSALDYYYTWSYAEILSSAYNHAGPLGFSRGVGPQHQSRLSKVTGAMHEAQCYNLPSSMEAVTIVRGRHGGTGHSRSAARY